MYSSYSYSDAMSVGAGTTAAAGVFAGLGVALLFIWIIGMATTVLMIISLWKIFKKAGKNGWEAIIPIYNMITLVQITEKPLWYIIFFFLPITPIIIYIALTEKFGKSVGYAVLMLLVPIVGFPMLAFGKSEYKGSAASASPAPEVTAAPAEPAVPVAPAEPAAPASEPATPAPEPVAPIEPAAPVEPVVPAEPVATAPAPEAPAAPAPEPAAPAAPEPVAPVEPAAPVEPVVPAEPVAPAPAPEAPPASAEPVTPTEPTTPVQPAQ